MSKPKAKNRKLGFQPDSAVELSSSFSVQGKKALLDMLAARPLRAALFDANGVELSDGLGYSQGGVALMNAITGSEPDGQNGGIAFLSFQDPQWPSAGFMGAAQMRIFDGETDTVFAALNFAEPLNGQGATFRVELPPRLITL